MLYIGIIGAIIGSIIWYKQDMNKHTYIINIPILFCIFLLLLGVFLIIANIDFITNLFKNKQWITNITTLGYVEVITIFMMIYLGTALYIIASYYHLKIKNWTFLKALVLALPIVLCEYQFSLRGNYLANTILKFNAVQIVLITMIFYFINAWLLNVFVLKQSVIWWRELIAFIFIGFAFLITTSYG